MKRSTKSAPALTGDLHSLQQKLQLLGCESGSRDPKENRVGKDTEEASRDFQHKRGLRPTGQVDVRTPRQIDEAMKALPPRAHVVRGKAVFRHEKEMRSLKGVIVRAFDKNLHREESLGEATTDADGAYEIRYTSEQFPRADLVVRVFSPEGIYRCSEENLRRADCESIQYLTSHRYSTSSWPRCDQELSSCTEVRT